MKHGLKIKMNDFVYYFTYIYLMLNFFILTNNKISKIVDVSYFAVMISFIIAYLLKNKIKLNNFNIKILEAKIYARKLQWFYKQNTW